MKHLFKSSVIADAELAEYLKDKLLIKPDYGYSTERESKPTSDWLKRIAAQSKIRDDNNNNIKRGLRR